MPVAGSPAARLSESALGTLPLLAYLALSVALMVSDHRGGIGQALRKQAQLLAQPVWAVAALPQYWARQVGDYWADHAALRAENQRLQHDLAVSNARLHRLAAVADENQRLRELLGGTRGYRLSAQLAGIVGVDLDPWRQRLLLDAGAADGVEVGQALLDGGGVLGQVIEVMPRRSTALLITDPDHAIPVQVARTGLRAVAYGTGRRDLLRLPNIPQSADLQIGDRLLTSGIGGRFPAGFPVGTVTALHPDDTRLFVVAEAAPSARLDRGTEVLLVKNSLDESDFGPLPADSGAKPEAGPQP